MTDTPAEPDGSAQPTDDGQDALVGSVTGPEPAFDLPEVPEVHTDDPDVGDADERAGDFTDPDVDLEALGVAPADPDGEDG